MTERRPSFEVRLSALWTGGYDRHDRTPISELAGTVEHVHGSLEILVDRVPLPALGFFGPDDVCLNEWARELDRLASTLERDPSGRYVYDEGEQGQPSYEFARRGEQVLVSVLDGSGGGQADPAWSSRPCDVSDLLDSIGAFQGELRAVLIGAAGNEGAEWLDRILNP